LKLELLEIGGEGMDKRHGDGRKEQLPYHISSGEMLSIHLHPETAFIIKYRFV
jgi:hypothetical protein